MVFSEVVEQFKECGVPSFTRLVSPSVTHTLGPAVKYNNQPAFEDKHTLDLIGSCSTLPFVSVNVFPSEK